MSKIILKNTRHFSALTLLVAAIAAAFFSFVDVSHSALPTMGSLDPAGPTVTWVGTAAGGSSATETTCVEGVNCDSYALTLSGTPANWAGKKAHIKISWPVVGDDFDVFVHKGATKDAAGRPTGPLVGSSAAGGAGPEEVDLDPSIASVGTGVFLVHVVYFLVTPTDQYNGEASVLAGAVPTPAPSPGSTPTPTPVPPNTPRYQNYVAPPGFGEDSGEPSIGSNWMSENVTTDKSMTFTHTFMNGTVTPAPNGGRANYYGGFLAQMLRITFDDCSSPAVALWEKKPLTLASTPRALGDPILFTDHGYPALVGPGRTFVSQEEGQVGSTTDVTDNDGDTFMPSQGAGAPAGVDHQTIAAGPYSTNVVIPPISATPYPPTGPRRAVYYASQSVSDARTSRSDDGGITFGPAVPMYTLNDCKGLHGHLKVAPDGTVYVAHNACGGIDLKDHTDGQQAVIVSENNGVTWSIRKIPTTDTKPSRDPSVGIATDGTIYMGQQSKDGHARISVSHDRGLTWDQFPGQAQLQAYDVGAQLGIQNMVFAEVVAGDPDRSSFAFYGTTTGGTDYDQPSFPGVWYLYIASTFDGGKTWLTQNATPNDPVQRGGICNGGACRNLLDFFDATIDKEGRVLIGGEDGCVGGCDNGGANSFTAKAFLTRQSGGKGMFAAFDVPEPTLPGAPAVTGTVNSTQTSVQLSWPVPDSGGGVITGYNVYKSVGGGAFALLATVNVPTYTDTAFNKTVPNSYRVTALNNSGSGGATTEGPYCHDFVPSLTAFQSACVLPGVQVINDVLPSGADNDNAPNIPVEGSVNIKQLYVAEPFVSSAVDNLFFTLQVAPSTTGSAPPNSQWFIIWDRQGTDPSDPNDPKYDRLYVAMRTDAAGTPTFDYGKFGHAIILGPPPPPPDGGENIPVMFGAADGGSYNPQTGLITVTVSKSKYRAIDGGSPKYNPGSFLAGINVRTLFNRPGPGPRSQGNASDITDNSNYSIVGNASCAPAPDIASAVSRKTHGTAGTFDVRLVPLDSSSGIECRSGGGSGTVAGSYNVVITFAAPVTFTGVNATGGAVPTAAPAPGSPPTSEVTVHLSNVQNAVVTNITLAGATAGGAAADVTIPLKVLIGDTTADRSVNSADINQTKSQSGRVVTGSNFREDLTADGAINGADISLVKSKSGTALRP